MERNATRAIGRAAGRGALGGHVGGDVCSKNRFCIFWGPSWGHVGAKLALFGVIFEFFLVSKLNFNLEGI